MIHSKEQVITREDRPLFGLTPFDDESFFGFTARLAAWNHFDGRRTFLASAGFTDFRRHGLEAALGDNGRLAWRLRLNEEQLARLTGRHDPNLLDYKHLLTVSARRVSPTGLRKAPYHRAAWAQQLPFCPKSWGILIDQCPSCAKRLGWIKVLDVETCEHCGFDLREADTPVVPPSQRKMLALMAGLIDRDPSARLPPRLSLPPHIAECSPFEIFELAMVFSRGVALTRGRSKLTMCPPITQAACMAAGMEIIVRYPESFDEIVAQSDAALPKLFKVVRAYAGGRSSQIFQQLYSDWELGRHGVLQLRQRRRNEGKLTLREAAQALRMQNGDLRHLIDRGLVGGAKARAPRRKHQWLEPGDVHSAARQLENRMSFKECSEALGIPIRGVAQLVSLGVLDRNQDPVVTALHAFTQLDKKAAEALAKRILALRRVPMPRLPVIPLEDVFQGIGGQEKPWGAILRAALELDIAIYCDEGFADKLVTRNLQISQEVAHDIVARRRPDLLAAPELSLDEWVPDRLTTGDVESYLNCFPRDVSWLIDERRLSEKLGHEEVKALGREVISSREIAWRWRISPALRETLPKYHGMGGTLGPFWPRAAVEEHFSARFPFGRPT